VDSLNWSQSELRQGKRITIKGFPKDHKVQCFRVEVSTHRTDFVVTNDLAQDSTEAAQQACGLRWKIEQLHRETKQVTGLEACPCRKARIQRSHIGCAFLVWVRLNALAKQAGQTIYQLKHGLLEELKHEAFQEQLKSKSAAQVVYVDEAGIDNREEHPYGYCEIGQRFSATQSGKRTERVSWLAALK
jgi:hypothetical protein